MNIAAGSPRALGWTQNVRRGRQNMSTASTGVSSTVSPGRHGGKSALHLSSAVSSRHDGPDIQVAVPLIQPTRLNQTRSSESWCHTIMSREILVIRPQGAAKQQEHKECLLGSVYAYEAQKCWLFSHQTAKRPCRALIDTPRLLKRRKVSVDSLFVGRFSLNYKFSGRIQFFSGGNLFTLNASDNSAAIGKKLNCLKSFETSSVCLQSQVQQKLWLNLKNMD